MNKKILTALGGPVISMRFISTRQQERDHRGLRYTCAACGSPESVIDPLTLTDDGMRVHRSHAIDPKSGLFGHEQDQ